MNDPSISNPAYQALTDQQLSVIDALCDRFDRELVQGAGPRIETFLAEAPKSARDGLLAELLAMEIEYRSEQGDAPQCEEYIRRFPEQERNIAGVFSREATPQFPGNVSTSTQAGVPPEMGNFRLIEEIGHGGMGVVLKAHDKKLKRDVAIKVLAPHLAANVEAVQRFLREAQSAAAVRHDNVVTIYAVDEANGTPFLVMELIDGESLQDRLKHGPLPVDAIVQFGIQIASGLDAAHRRGLIHRDIKPANILLERQKEPGDPEQVRVKITDFGLARVMSESVMTRSGLIAGTPQYMSPEQANGKPLDHRSDLFSLGSVLYSLCTGQAAFHAESAIVVLRRVSDHEPEPIRAVNPAIPDWLCDVIAKLMAKQPEDRIQTAKEVADLLKRCQAPSRERRDGLTTADTLHIGPSVPPESSSLETSLTTALLPASSIAPQGSSSGPITFRLTRTLIAVALLAGVVLAVVFSRGRDPRPTGLDLSATNPAVRPQAESVLHDAAKVPPRAIAPFNAAQAQQHQKAWAAHLKLPVEITNSIGMKFRLVPPGEFLMGSTPEEIEAELKRPDLCPHLHFWRTQIESEGPQHKVVLTKPIYVGVTEVTQAQYEQVMGTNPSRFSASGQGKAAVANLETGNYPVELVSCNESAEFCAKLSQQEKLKPFNFRSDQTVTSLDGTGYRLPTEAEWEFACRAGTTTRFWSGNENEDLIQAGWCLSNYGGRTHAASELKANPFGLSDMHGNVWEWVQDGGDPKFYGQFQENVATDPFSPLSASTMPMRRGGSIAQVPELARSSSRLYYHTCAEAGFRVVLVADAVKELLAKSEANAPSSAVAPFDEAQARAHQEKWAMHLGVPVEYENSIGMKFLLVPPGEFLMGSKPEEIEAALKVAAYPDWREKIVSEGPQHKVILTKPIYVGATEVTQSQYEQVMGTNPSFFSATGQGKEAVVNLETGNLPVESVSWFDAVEFCAKLSQQEKLKPFDFRSGETVTLLEGIGYRLPTEAEWEYACRAGTTTRFWSGDEDQDLLHSARFVSNSGGRTHPVGELKTNPFGLSDMHGNVWEWVQDSWDPAFYAQFQEAAAIDPASPFSAELNPLIFRGGNWNSSPSECRASFRLALRPSLRPNYVGFRVVLVIGNRP